MVGKVDGGQFAAPKCAVSRERMLSVFIKPSEDQCPKTMVWLRFCLSGLLNLGTKFGAFLKIGF